MRIENKIKSNITNFGSRPLYRATLLSKKLFNKPEPVEAFVSMAEKKDFGREALGYRRWFFTTYGDDILYLMEEQSKHPKKVNADFLLVDIPSFAAKKQVAAMASYNVGYDNLILKALQSKSEIALFNRIKGAGSLIVYALSKIAQKNDKKAIVLSAATGAKKFYKKLGFKNIEAKEFMLPKEKYEMLQRKLEEKFHITEVTNN